LFISIILKLLVIIVLFIEKLLVGLFFAYTHYANARKAVSNGYLEH